MPPSFLEQQTNMTESGAMSTNTKLPIDGRSDGQYALTHQEQDRFRFSSFVSDGAARAVYSSHCLLKTIIERRS